MKFSQRTTKQLIYLKKKERIRLMTSNFFKSDLTKKGSQTVV